MPPLPSLRTDLVPVVEHPSYHRPLTVPRRPPAPSQRAMHANTTISACPHSPRAAAMTCFAMGAATLPAGAPVFHDDATATCGSPAGAKPANQACGSARGRPRPSLSCLQPGRPGIAAAVPVPLLTTRIIMSRTVSRRSPRVIGRSHRSGEVVSTMAAVVAHRPESTMYGFMIWPPLPSAAAAIP